jgi:hypothetical protein
MKGDVDFDPLDISVIWAFRTVRSPNKIIEQE